MEEFFFALIPITFILSFAGVLIFRPLTKRLGNVMEANALAKQQVVDDKLHHEHVKTLLETQNLKIQQLEQRIEIGSLQCLHRVHAPVFNQCFRCQDNGAGVDRVDHANALVADRVDEIMVPWLVQLQIHPVTPSREGR